MYRKCYPIANALNVGLWTDNEAFAPKKPRWTVFSTTYERMFVLALYHHGVVRCAPLYVHSFRVTTAKRLTDALWFQRQEHSEGELQAMGDRLLWHRLRLGLMQKEVAARVGLGRTVYALLEAGGREICSAETARALAELYHTSVEELLDGYNLFLYRGQGQQIRACRERTGLTRKAFAKRYGICESCLEDWEKERVLMSKRAWEKHFRDLMFAFDLP